MDLCPYLFCLSFYPLYFVLPPFEDNGLPFWVPDVLCQHSEIVLWNLLSVQMFLWWICGEKVVSPSYSSTILGLPPRTVFWTLWEKATVGWFERVALKRVYYHMWSRSPVQVLMHEQDAHGWCAGMTLGDGMGREVGGGFWMGNTCAPVADSCRYMAKTTTIL